MFADPVTFHIIGVDAPNSASWALTGLSGNASTRQYLAAGAGGPKLARFSHSVVGKGDAVRDRHLVRFESYVVEDSIENPAKPISMYAVADIPRVGTTSTQKIALWRTFSGFFLGSSGAVAYDNNYAGFVEKWLSGQS